MRIALLRSLIPRAATSFQAHSATRVAACHSLPPHSLSSLTPSVRASGNGRGPWLEADNAAEEDANNGNNTATMPRPPSPRHRLALQEESSSSSQAAASEVAEAVVQQLRQQRREQELLARAYRGKMIEATQQELVEPVEYWVNLAQEVGVPLNADAFTAMGLMYITLGRLDLAAAMWDVMQYQEVDPPIHYCARMIRAWGRRRDLAAVDEWTARAKQAGHLQSDELQHACVVAWGDCGEIDRVFAWADARSSPIPAPFIKAFLIALGKNGKTDQFEEFCHGLFTSWTEEGQEAPAIPRLLSLDVASAVIRYHPDSTIAQNVFNSTQVRVARASVAGSPSAAETANNAATFNRVQRDRLGAAEVMGAMMARCLAERRFAETLEVLDTVLGLGLPPTPSMCAEVLRMHAAVGNVEGVEAVWGDIVRHGILPESDVFVATLQEFGGRKNIEAVDQWVERATRQGFDKHPEVQRAFIAAWATCGHPERLLQWAKNRKA